MKKDKKYRYVIFDIRNNERIAVEILGERSATYDDFLRDLQKNGARACRYGLFDFEYEYRCQGTAVSFLKSKMFLMCWCPDTAMVKDKMLYASSFEALKRSLVGVQRFVQATDLSEASFQVVEAKLRGSDRE